MRCALWFAVLAVGVGASGGLGSAPPPDPTKGAGVPAKQLPALLGKDHFSDELQQLRKAMKESPVATYHTDLDKCFYHSWRDQGVELRFDGANKLECIFLYADSVDGFRPYKGELPARLSFKDAADAVEKKLGRPTEAIGGDTTRCRWEYPAKGVAVEFRTTDPKNRKAPVAMIVLFRPDTKKKD
jgi:hypothetical protein